MKWDMGAHKDYWQGLLARFGDRPVLSRRELIDLFRADEAFDEARMSSLFALLEEIYRIPAGILRPSDHIDLLVERVPEKRWWRGPVHDVIAGDRQFWIQEELARQTKGRLDGDEIGEIKTVLDLVRAWCE